MANELLFNCDFDDDCECNSEYISSKNTWLESLNNKYYDFNVQIHEVREVCIKETFNVYNFNDNYTDTSKEIMQNNIKSYFKNISTKYINIILDKHIMNNMPTIKGTRIPVTNILACLRDEMTINEICEAYNLTPDQVEESVEYVIEIIKNAYQEDEE